MNSNASDTVASRLIGAYRIVRTRGHTVRVENDATGYHSVTECHTLQCATDEFNAACDLARQAC